MQVKFIPPPNDQKYDPEFNWDGIIIKGGSQCQGNSNQDLLHSVGLEFDIKPFVGWITKDYYIHFYAYMSKRNPPKRKKLMHSDNHCWFMNELFKDFNVPVISKVINIPNRPSLIADAIEYTKRPVSIGTMLSSSGHWISVHGFEEDVFNCNDPYGQHPYKKSQRGGYVKYGSLYLKKNTVIRLLTIEDK